MDISIHAPRVGGDVETAIDELISVISIHAPRVGGDDPMKLKTLRVQKFQSTPPVWGATRPTIGGGGA